MQLDYLTAKDTKKKTAKGKKCKEHKGIYRKEHKGKEAQRTQRFDSNLANFAFKLGELCGKKSERVTAKYMNGSAKNTKI